jgi:hypothetical protein
MYLDFRKFFKKLLIQGEKYKERVSNEMNYRTKNLVVIDYLYREVSVQSGEGIFEALQDFGEILYYHHDYKKRGKIKEVSICYSF